MRRLIVGIFALAGALAGAMPPVPPPLPDKDLCNTVLAASSVHVEVSVGELVDKITILEIKQARIKDRAKLEDVSRELDVLNLAREAGVPKSETLKNLTTDLKTVNEALWEVEDELREHERRRDFGERFVELARSVYRLNDQRADLKRKINELVGSRLKEVKSYSAY